MESVSAMLANRNSNSISSSAIGCLAPHVDCCFATAMHNTMRTQLHRRTQHHTHERVRAQMSARSSRAPPCLARSSFSCCFTWTRASARLSRHRFHWLCSQRLRNTALEISACARLTLRVGVVQEKVRQASMEFSHLRSPLDPLMKQLSNFFTSGDFSKQVSATPPMLMPCVKAKEISAACSMLRRSKRCLQS